MMLSVNDDYLSQTQPNRPFPKRPEDGFLAWQATIGYISTHHSPDVLLQVEAYPSVGHGIAWRASLSWGGHHEMVSDYPSLPSALRELWLVVEKNHTIFRSPIDAIRRPYGYHDHEWFDEATLDILHRLIHTTQNVFKEDWRILWVYQPSEMPDVRVQMRMLAIQMTYQASGRGASLLDAGRELFRNAAPVYQRYLESSKE